MGGRSKGVKRGAIQGVIPVSRLLLNALLVAALLELLLNRIVTRLGMHIPAEALSNPAVVAAYSVLSMIGLIAFNVASVLAAVLLLVLIVQWRREEQNTRSSLGLVLIAGLLAIGLLPVLLSVDPRIDRAFEIITLLTMGFLMVVGLCRGRSFIVAWGALFFCYYYYRFAQVLEFLPGGMEAFRLGEAFWVLGGLLAYHAVSGEGRKRSVLPLFLLAGTTAGWLAFTVLGGATVARLESTPAILAIWSLGLTLYLPLPLYLTAAVLYAVAMARLYREGSPAAHGIAFLLIAGYTLLLTYQVILAVLGMALLARGGAARVREKTGAGVSKWASMAVNAR
ncbi:MAG: hypothetical protein HZA23_03725 [Nitrospirae bacterium]|nr:hypothetical protein [Nitrospirota bacterium]